MKCQNRQFTKFISLLKFPGLQYSAKPQCGGILGVSYVIVRQNHSIPNVLSKLAERTEHTHSTLHGRCADVPRADHDRAGSRVALRIEILCMPFFHLFDFLDISKCRHRFRFPAKKDHWCDRPFLHGDLGRILSVLSRWCDGDGGFQSFQVPRNFRSQ